MENRMDLRYYICMARRKIGQESVRSIQKSSGSYHVSIPMSIMRGLGWKERQKVVIEKFGKGRIIISDWK